MARRDPPTDTPKAGPAPVALVAQPHGGALRQGGTNRGGPGNPPSILRERLRGSFEHRVAVLESIADGEVVEQAELPLGTLLAHAFCPTCGDVLAPAGAPADLTLVSLDVRRSASASERIKAIDLLAKYGLGTAAGVPTEVVREKLHAMVELVRARLAPDVADSLVVEMRGLWQ